MRQVLEETERAGRGRGQRLRHQLERFVPLVGPVIHQARTRVLEGGKVAAQQKVLSLFEPHTRVIPRHKGGAAVEFGRTVVVDEVEGGIVTRYHILAAGATEHGELAPALEHHQEVFGHPPRLVTADRGLHHADNERVAREAWVIPLVIPAWGQGTSAQRARQRTWPWRRCYRWRAGIEGRSNSLRRDYGLKRCADHGAEGLERCVGCGILASNLRQIGQNLAA